MEIIDEDDEHEEEGKNEKQKESENRVILGTIKKTIERQIKLETKIGLRKSFSLLFQVKTISFK